MVVNDEDFYVIDTETGRKVLADDFLDKISALPLLGTVKASSLHNGK